MRLLLVLFLALLPMPALADVTVRYELGKQVLTVEVDDGGDSRIDVGGKFGIIRRGGTDYAVMMLPNGDGKVTPLAELVTMVSAMVAGESAPPLSEMQFVLVGKGPAEMAGRQGMLWSFGPANSEELKKKGGNTLELVVSSDPQLAPIGATLHRTLVIVQPLLALVAPASSGFGPKAVELAAKGTPLGADKLFTLKTVETANIDPKRFELPAPAVSAMEFLSAMESGGAEFKPLP